MRRYRVGRQVGEGKGEGRESFARQSYKLPLIIMTFFSAMLVKLPQDFVQLQVIHIIHSGEGRR